MISATRTPPSPCRGGPGVRLRLAHPLRHGCAAPPPPARGRRADAALPPVPGRCGDGGPAPQADDPDRPVRDRSRLAVGAGLLRRSVHRDRLLPAARKPHRARADHPAAGHGGRGLREQGLPEAQARRRPGGLGACGRRGGGQRRRRPQGEHEGRAGDAEDRQRRSRHLPLRSALVRPDRPARRRQDDGPRQLRPEVPLGARQQAGRRRRRRRHALLRLVVHRRRRADRHGRTLHDAGLRTPAPMRRAGSRFWTR